MERASSPGSFHLFRLFGIDVFLHWTWLLIAYFQVQRSDQYSHIFWPILEYLLLFGIVTLHEFGHALACRSVGGRAGHIVLWPLGGIAFVQPPQRPGAVLWSIAAGPLVNVVLVPVTLAAYWGVSASAGAYGWPRDMVLFTFELVVINLGLLIFNVLPIYPLDGGQILQALLWFFLPRSTSLRIAAGIGLGIGVLMAIPAAWLAATTGAWLLLLLVLFLIWQAWNGLQLGNALASVETADAERAPWKM